VENIEEFHTSPKDFYFAIKLIKAAFIFIIVWLLIPWLVGLSLKELKIGYDPIVVNEIIILVGSGVFMLMDFKQKHYGFSLKFKYLMRITFLMLALQSITIISLALLIALSVKLPAFIYSESLTTIFLKYILLVPLAEEIFMRGLIQTNLSFLKGSVKVRSIQLSYSVIVTAVLFGTMHLLPLATHTFKDFLSSFILGLIAGYYREKTGSLFPAFAAHAAYNFRGGFVGKVMV
jgi:membrane protease YdiL (CAAX protease family)